MTKDRKKWRKQVEAYLAKEEEEEKVYTKNQKFETTQE